MSHRVWTTRLYWRATSLIDLALGDLAAPALFVASRPAGGSYVGQIVGAGSVLNAPEFHVEHPFETRYRGHVAPRVAVEDVVDG